jgi:hypothetical protein
MVSWLELARVVCGWIEFNFKNLIAGQGLVHAGLIILIIFD